ncbi:MAG TPA: response regulator transcription factor [Candidatus Tenderia sp.]|nr:response regulator transcription factor [Candidatus Tenderia sp.]
MKVLIVDDEPLARSRLRDLLSDIGHIDVLGEASNGLEALRLTQTLQPDVVLLDIRMPVMTGIEAARHMTELPHPPAVIFTTAYGDHALEAFDANAVDYLLKPIRMARLEQALQKSQALSRNGADTARPGAPDSEERTHICAHHRGNLILVPVADILFFQADNKYIVVRHSGGEVLIDESLKSLEEEFSHRFTRIHRNALVANPHIKTLEKASDGHHYIHLQGVDEGLAVSRRQLSVVRKVVAAIGGQG